MQAPTRDSSDTFKAVNPLLCCMSETNSSALGAFTSASGSNRRSPLFLTIGLRSDFKTANSGIGSPHSISTRRKASTRLPLLQTHGLSSRRFIHGPTLICSSNNENTSIRLVLIVMCLLCVCSYATLSTGRPVPRYNVAP